MDRATRIPSSVSANSMVEITQRPMSLVEIITEALQETAKQASGQNIGLAWTVDPALPPYVSAKRVDLQSIVMVLIHRALSVMRDSPLHLTIAGNGPDRVLVQLEDDGRSAPLPPKHWEQLEFWVEELSGQISRDHEGLLWTLALPLDVGEVDLVMPERGQLTVLLASADTDVRAKILNYLHIARHVVIEAATQSSVSEHCRQNAFDLLILDSDLPGDGGPQSVLKGLRSDFPIALLANDNPFQDARWQGAEFWLHKPPRDSELTLALNAAYAFRSTELRKLIDATRSKRRQKKIGKEEKC